MAKFCINSVDTTTNTTKGGFIMNFVRFFLNFFKSLFTTMFRKEKTPSRWDILNHEFEVLHKENEILEEVINLLRRGCYGWNDPYTYSKVCDLIKQIARDPSRYNGAEELHDLAGGIFYYRDKECEVHEIPYHQMNEEYMLLKKRDAIPRDWDKYVHANCNYSYLAAMQCIQKYHMPKILWHTEFRFKKNKERMNEIMEELFGPVSVEA